MNCDAYLANAQRIYIASNKQPDQCASRAIIHAAYYSIFHFVAGKLSLDVTGADAAKHSDLKRRLQNYVGPDSSLNEARRHFLTLQRARVDADYKLEKGMTINDVRLAIERALSIYQAAGITPTVA